MDKMVSEIDKAIEKKISGNQRKRESIPWDKQTL